MKSLSTILAELSFDALQPLAALWGAEAPQEDTIAARQQLERAMRDSVATRFIWERLHAHERHVLFAVIGPSARNWCTVESLHHRAHLDPSTTAQALETLEAAHILFREDAKIQDGMLIGQRVTFYGYAIPRNPKAEIEEKTVVYVPTELVTGLYATGRELFMPQADRSSMSLDDLLMAHRQGDLDQLGRRFGLTIQAYYSRNEVRTAIAQNLVQAEAVQYALARITARMRDTYDWMRARGGRVSFIELRAQVALDGPELAALVRSLEEYALAFDTFSEQERVLFIPRETMENLRRADDRPTAQAGLRARVRPQAVQPSETPVLWDLAVLVAAAHQHDIELTRSGSLPKRTAQRLIPLLTGPRAHRDDDEALAYVEMLKQEANDLGLVSGPTASTHQRSHLRPGMKLASWARHDLVMQTRRLERRWPTNRNWTDPVGARYHDWMGTYIDLSVAREAVRTLLLTCVPGEWYALSSFLATLRSDDPYVFRPSQRSAGDSGFRLAEDLRAQWDDTDGQIVVGMFRGALYELGLVALGYDREQVPGGDENVNPDAFMLTSLGAEVLTSELSAREQPSTRSLVVQPNFEVLLMEPHMPTLYWLEQFAVLGQVGRVSRFTLTGEALRRGLALGGTIDEVVCFLETHASKQLPQNVIYTLRDWARQEVAVPQPVALLEFGDDEIAGEMVTSPKLQAFRLRRVGPRKVAVLPQPSLRELRRALETLGYAQRLLSGFEELVAAATTLPSRRHQGRRRKSGSVASAAIHVHGA